LVTATLNNNTPLAADDFRRNLPRFSDAHWNNNLNLAEAFAKLAAVKGCTPAQLALAWVLAQGEDIIPIPGTKRRTYLHENAGALDVSLTNVDLQNIEAVLAEHPDVGQRYNDGSMKLLDE
jgi:aryl-alcohol dehydrogenase-like predicted oxidoreductase